MTFSVVTACSREYMPLSALTSPPKLAYAMKNGYNFIPCLHAQPHRVSWERVDIWKKCILAADWMFFTGCDATITNLDIKLESFISDDVDFIFAVDGCGLQSDSWIMRNCEATKRLLEKIGEQEGKLQNEQDAMTLELSDEKIMENHLSTLPEPRRDGGVPASQDLIRFLNTSLNRSPVRCKIVSQRQLNAYPIKHYGGTGEEEWSWKEGDFVCHLPGKSLDYRLNAFSKENFPVFA